MHARTPTHAHSQHTKGLLSYEFCYKRNTLCSIQRTATGLLFGMQFLKIMNSPWFVVHTNSSFFLQAQCLLHISGDAALVDHMMPHGTTGIQMMSPPPQAMEPIEPSKFMLQRKSKTVTSQHQCTEC